MLLVAQIRAARSLLGWTAQDLANFSKVGITTIRKIEVQEGIAKAQLRTVEDIRRAFEEAGIEFIGKPENGAGVRFKIKA
jgi:predicted transcriptional regulator